MISIKSTGFKSSSNLFFSFFDCPNPIYDKYIYYKIELKTTH